MEAEDLSELVKELDIMFKLFVFVVELAEELRLVFC